MKPIIISVAEDKDGYIKIKKEELEKYIEQAYLNGVQDRNQAYNPFNNPFGGMERDINTGGERNRDFKITWVGV